MDNLNSNENLFKNDSSVIHRTYNMMIAYDEKEYTVIGGNEFHVLPVLNDLMFLAQDNFIPTAVYHRHCMISNAESLSF